MCLMSINYYWCFDILGGYEGTLRAAEETKMLEQILQHELQLAPPELIEKLAKTYYVTVFAKSYCPYSKRVKEFFATSNVLFKAVDLDTLGEQGKEIQAVLREKNWPGNSAQCLDQWKFHWYSIKFSFRTLLIHKWNFILNQKL